MKKNVKKINYILFLFLQNSPEINGSKCPLKFFLKKKQIFCFILLKFVFYCDIM